MATSYTIEYFIKKIKNTPPVLFDIVNFPNVISPRKGTKSVAWIMLDSYIDVYVILCRYQPPYLKKEALIKALNNRKKYGFPF